MTKSYNTLLTKITEAEDEAVLSYHIVHGLYFPEVVFAVTIRVL